MEEMAHYLRRLPNNAIFLYIFEDIVESTNIFLLKIFTSVLLYEPDLFHGQALDTSFPMFISYIPRSEEISGHMLASSENDEISPKVRCRSLSPILKTAHGNLPKNFEIDTVTTVK